MATLKPFQVQFIDHWKQRYDTCGDWFETKRFQLFRISKLKDWRYCVLIAVHEIVEWALCKQQGVTEQSVDEFDFAWKGDGEPGDDPSAPYHLAHVFATDLEHQLAVALHVNWDAYDAAIEDLDGTRTTR